MFSIKARIINDLRLNSIVMVVIISVLSLYGIITDTSLFEPNFYALWMTAGIDGTLSSIAGLILQNIR